ncbi:2-keto-4-pentenoate hydratase [Paraburkholderia haematera]|uniref:2-keto-4-pentenoate hydratase n=1 Tax=Paraburkholderia haematera TaxID=2793077 RepID=A0ABM8SJ37_9BURK|nr:hypothetical protein [Paraburkholderia haematera]CAE6813605.1 2-keto-4-pentenoate hydratase [Paraburkholderia haematera]
MNDILISSLGDELYAAVKDCRVVDPLTSRHPDLMIDDAYRIQQRVNARRIEAGERVIGKKIGVTSQVVMDMLGVHQPDFGMLTDAMLYEQGDAIPAAALIHPKAEGEIAFVLKRDLQGPGVTAADVLAATGGVMACFEIVDSRIRDWKIRIEDTVADNASCGAGGHDRGHCAHPGQGVKSGGRDLMCLSGFLDRLNASVAAVAMWPRSADATFRFLSHVAAMVRRRSRRR